MTPGDVRVGWGIDAHRLGGTGPMILGGVQVANDIGVEATSDGDVVAHAVADALLGAAALGDLGHHFPSHDPAWEDADSMDLLARVVEMAAEADWRPSHVDVTVIAESVRIAPQRDLMRARLGSVLGLDISSISVKATTTDGMGLIGGGDGIAVYAAITAVPSS